jgi:hypothetical protein
MGVKPQAVLFAREQIPTRFALAAKATSPLQGEVRAVNSSAGIPS